MHVHNIKYVGISTGSRRVTANQNEHATVLLGPYCVHRLHPRVMTSWTTVCDYNISIVMGLCDMKHFTGAAATAVTLAEVVWLELYIRIANHLSWYDNELCTYT